MIDALDEFAASTRASTTPKPWPSIACSRLSDRSATPVTNALGESFLDSFKTGLIADRVWRLRSQLELAVVEYIGLYNAARLHESLDYLPPAKHEQLHDLRERSTLAGTHDPPNPVTPGPRLRYEPSGRHLRLRQLLRPRASSSRGAAWESNPPSRGLHDLAGFEDDGRLLR